MKIESALCKLPMKLVTVAIVQSCSHYFRKKKSG